MVRKSKLEGGIFMYDRDLFEVSDGNHVMLIYENDNDCLEAAVHFINEALKSDQLCIYASVHTFDNHSKLSASSLSPQITDIELNTKKGNIQFIDFKSFYESALESDLSPFILFKQKLENTLKDRISNGKGDKIMVYADAACSLTEHEEFDESRQLETWWKHTHEQWASNDYKITLICPHPADILKQNIEVKWNIADVHDMMVFLKSHIVGSSRENITRNNLRILIAESEPDIMTLYVDYLSALGHDVSVVTDSNKCLSLFKKRDFDLIILDTHITGFLSTNDLAKEIVRIEPRQRILVTSTNPYDDVSKLLGNLAPNIQQILLKPFHLSELVNVIMQSGKNN